MYEPQKLRGYHLPSVSTASAWKPILPASRAKLTYAARQEEHF